MIVRRAWWLDGLIFAAAIPMACLVWVGCAVGFQWLLYALVGVVR